VPSASATGHRAPYASTRRTRGETVFNPSLPPTARPLPLPRPPPTPPPMEDVRSTSNGPRRMSVPRLEITEYLRASEQGDDTALERLLPMVYVELRAIAARHLRSERAAPPCSRPRSPTRPTSASAT
jgi:hypothetical protein